MLGRNVRGVGGFGRWDEMRRGGGERETPVMKREGETTESLACKVLAKKEFLRVRGVNCILFMLRFVLKLCNLITLERKG